MAALSHHGVPMIEHFFAMTLTKVPCTVTLALCSLLFSTCSPSLREAPSATPSPSLSPTPPPAGLVAFLSEGAVFTVDSEVAGAKPVRIGQAEEQVDEFLWSADGKSVLLASGLRLTSASTDGAGSNLLGVVAAPSGTTLDRLQASLRPDVIIVHANDRAAAPHVYAFETGTRTTRELTIDQYADLVPAEPPTIHGFSEFSVSPDLMRVLYKAAVGIDEQLFVSDLERGYRTQLTAIEAIEGFEESVDGDGGRRIIAASWSPDGRFILFNPAQSCSESGLCYGQLFMVDSLNGKTHRLSQGMMVGLDAAWNKRGTKLLFEDGGRIFLSTTAGESRALADGNRPRWQPVP
jgi:hypothetical protein